jgi:REP-associated tyrosine transposase
VAIGGTADHVHLLIGMKSSHRIDYLVRDIKAHSSEWIHRALGKRTFQWQKGYGAFSVSPSNIERVRRYVLTQEEHHRRVTFQVEYLRLLKESGVDYDELYLW